MQFKVTTSALVALLSVASIAFGGYSLVANQASQIKRQTAAEPKIVEECRKIAAKAYGPFTQHREVAVMEECLVQRDPRYARDRFAEMRR